MLRDLKIGLRILNRERGFSALAITVLALGIAGVTTMFSVVNGVMLRGFDFPNADRLVSVDFVDPTSATAAGINTQMLVADYEALLDTQRSFDRVAAYLNGSTVNLTVDGQATRHTGAYVTEDFFKVLGVTPAMGRDFGPADNVPGAPRTVILGHGIWQRSFGGAADVVGRTLRVNGSPATVIGVMAAGFMFPVNEELWVPLFPEFPPRPRTDPNGQTPGVLALIKADVSYDQASSETTALAARLAKEFPDTNKAFSVGRVQRLLDTFTPPQIRGTLLTMLVFCVGVLLMACANVANMLFGRATLRARELAIRSSLGAGRRRLVRQMLTESLLLSTIGAVVGIVLAYVATDRLYQAIRALDPPPPAYIVFNIDGPALAITVLASMAAAVLSGLWPAWQSSRADAVAVLRDSSRGSTSARLGVLTRGLVVFQVTITAVLLIGAMLQVRSIVKQATLDYGYDTETLMSARMGLMEGDYPTAAARQQFYDRLLEQLERNGEYEAVALTSRFRMAFGGTAPIEIEGRTYEQEGDRLVTNFEQVTGGYFDVTGQRRLDGRTFTAQDLDARQPVAIVNAAFAQKHFPGQSAVGRRFRTAQPSGNLPGPWRTIVGVVSTVRMQGPFNVPGVDDAGFYVPFYSQPVGPLAEEPAAGRFATVLARPRGERVDAMASTIRRDVSVVDPNLPLYYVGTPAQQQSAFVSQNRIITLMFAVFGALAMVLAAAGVYGVMSFAVNQRRQELGVRMALGAERRSILLMVLRQGAFQVVLGTMLGVGLAYTVGVMAGAGIQTVLFDTSATDPVTYLAVTGLLALVSLIALLIPARRATAVDPMVALRTD
jgi:predicted permease